MGNITYCGQHQSRMECGTKMDAEVAAMELMFPGTVKEIQLSRALMTALDEMSSHTHFSEDVKQAFTELYFYYQWQMEQGCP
jgi:hypothetical protein